MNKNEEKRDQLIRETFDQCLSGIDELPSLRANILAKAKTRSIKWEPFRFRIPAIAMGLVLVLAFGFLAGTGRLSLSASPDEIKGGSQYTVQPIEVSLTEGAQNAVQEDGSPSPDTVLYYNPDHGSMYHVDPNCRSVDSRFQPLQGMFTFADLNSEPYLSLEPCTVCAAPLRKAEAGETDPSVIDQLAAAFPDLRDGLKPLSLSAENEDIRLNVISGRDRKGHITLLYTLEDLKARWFRDGDNIDVAPAFVQTEPFAGISGQVRQETLSGTHTKAGVANMMVHDQFQPDDTFTFTIDNLSVWENAIVDLIPVLEEHGTAAEGTALPDGALPRKHFDDAGTPSIAHDLNDLKVLDYSNPLDIALGDYAVLTGIGWIDNQLHVQVHRTGPVSFPVSQIGLVDDMAMGITNTVSGRRLPCQLVEWRAENSYDYTWMEFIWDSTPEDIHEELEAHITLLVDLVKGPWSVEIPAGAIQPDESAPEQAAADEKSGERPVKVSMELSKDHVSLGDEINVLISVTNTTGEDLPDVVELYDADGDKVPEEEDCTLAAGETKSWYKSWEISQSDLAAGKILYSIKYYAYDGPADEDGKPTLKEHKISFSKRIYPVSGSGAEEQLSFQVPVIEDELKPLNLSTEQQGLRVDLVSGLVQKNNAWFVYKLYDPDFSDETSLRYDYFMKNSQVGQFRFYHPYERASAHTYTDTFDTNNYGEPIASIAENGILTVGIENPVFYQEVNWDLTSLLKEYGTVSDGVLAPSQAEEGPQVYGGPDLPEVSLGAVVLDYTRPLNISLCPDADLTGIGWIGNRLHVQFHYTGNQPFLRAGDNMFSWEADCICSVPDNEDLPWTTIVWDDNDDGCYDWMEFVWDCAPETGISYLSANLIFPAKVKSGSWTFDVPLSSVTTDEPVMTEEQDTSRPADMDSESPISVIMILEKNNILPGETINVGLSLCNESEGGLLAGPVKVYDPSGKKIIDYQIDEGEIIDWNGAYTVTREMLLDGRLTFTMEYPAYDGPAGEDGKPTLKEHTVHFSREIFWACIDEETAAELDALPTNERAKAILERSYPEFAADLKPLNISCEDQGLRINLDYGVIKGEQGCFIWTLEDPEGKIIKEGLDPLLQFDFFDSDRNGNGYVSDVSSYVDYEKRTASFSGMYKFSHAYQLWDYLVEMCFTNPVNELVENVDLTAALREYGKVTEGVKAPTEAAAANMFYVVDEDASQPPEITKDLKVLDYTHPLDIPLIRDISLTGIGWIDNQLHIQVHYTGDTTDRPWGPGVGYWDAYLTAFLSDARLSYSYYTWMEWNENNYGAYKWKEFVLDCSPDDINQLTLQAQCNVIVDTSIGHWSVNVPLSDVLAEETSQDETLTVTDVETAVQPTDAPAIPAGMKPLNFSNDLGNVRFNLTSGLMKDNEFWFTLTLADQDGRQYTDCSDISLGFVGIGTEPDGWWGTIPSLIDTDHDGYGETFLVDWNGEFLRFENGSICLEINLVNIPGTLTDAGPVVFTIPVDAIFSDESTAAESRSGKPIKMEMELSKSRVSEGETVDVTITLSNQWDQELPGVIQLYAPDGELLSQWKYNGKRSFIITDTLTITAEQLQEGKITYKVKYQAYDGPENEDGDPTLQTHVIKFSKKITPAN